MSPSTFFRYFPTKDALVVTDEFDPLLIASFQAQPAHLSVLEAFKAASTETFGDLTAEQLQAQEERMRLVAAHPPLRAAVLDGLAEATVVLAGLVAARAGRAADDPEVLALVGALIGVAMSVLAGAGHLDAAAQMDVFSLAIERLGTGFTR